jgi:hypothetical protein
MARVPAKSFPDKLDDSKPSNTSSKSSAAAPVTKQEKGVAKQRVPWTIEAEEEFVQYQAIHLVQPSYAICYAIDCLLR